MWKFLFLAADAAAVKIRTASSLLMPSTLVNAAIPYEWNMESLYSICIAPILFILGSFAHGPNGCLILKAFTSSYPACYSWIRIVALVAGMRPILIIAVLRCSQKM